MTQEKAQVAYPEGDFAIVELLGHTTLIGRVSEVDRFGTKMLMLEPIWNNALLPPILQGGGSLYRVTPCSVEQAFRAQPREQWMLPDPIRALIPVPALPAPIEAAEADDGFRWSYSLDKRSWSEAPDRETAIERGRIDFGARRFWICEARRELLNDEFFDADAVIEMFEDANAANFGEDGPDAVISIDSKIKLEAALNAAWASWRAEHGDWWASAFAETRNKEAFPPEPAEADARADQPA